MSTSTIRVDDNNDIYVDVNGNLELLTDLQACTQDSRSACLMRLGEDIYNIRSGVDYFGFIFAPQTSYDDARKSISDNIMASPDVIGIESLDVEVANNVFKFEAYVITLHGTTVISAGVQK